MSIARNPSAITLPVLPDTTLLDFLSRTFPHVPPREWEDRLRSGKVCFDDGSPVTLQTPYPSGRRILYFREVDQEPVIPFTERILYQDDHILVACKPHFLPVVPGGRFVNECLEQRLRERTGIAKLVPLHRIDRETAGLVLCSVNPETRGLYHNLFRSGAMEKTYEAISVLAAPPAQSRWVVKNRLVRGEPRFRMVIADGPANACSEMDLLAVQGSRARFRLRPITGKTHQLRVHLSYLGYPIVNDRYYPELQAERNDDYARPLQLIARRLRFRDPVSGSAMDFHSERELLPLDRVGIDSCREN